jgi:hypothetical protein
MLPMSFRSDSGEIPVAKQEYAVKMGKFKAATPIFYPRKLDLLEYLRDFSLSVAALATK